MAGKSRGQMICKQVSTAEAQRPSWQERLPLLASISSRSGQQASSRKPWQTAISVCAHWLKSGSSGSTSLIFSSYSSETRMQKSNRFSSSISSAPSLLDCSFCSFWKAWVKSSKVAAECWVVESALMMRQSVSQSSLVAAGRELSALMRWIILSKVALASSRLPFSQRQQAMLQEREQLSGSISMPFLYSSRAFWRLPACSQPYPNWLCSFAELELRSFLMFWEMYSQCLIEASQSFWRLSNLPMALWPSRLILLKGSSASLLLKCCLYTAIALSMLSLSSSLIFTSRASCRVCFSRHSSNCEILSCAFLKQPLSIRLIPSASVRNSPAACSCWGMFCWEKVSKMFSTWLALRERRAMPPTESQQQRALSSNFLRRLKYLPISCPISSLMSHLGSVSSSLRRAMAASRLEGLWSSSTSTLARQNWAMML